MSNIKCLLLSLLIGVSSTYSFSTESDHAVVKTVVNDQPFVADFYCPNRATKTVGVLCLGGSEGGKPDILAKFFADHGYPSLAPAYFRAQGLPDTLEAIPLEYFDRTIAWLESNPHVAPGGIVVVGGSKGAELALLLASRRTDIIGVVAISPSSVVWQGLPKRFWPVPPARSSWTSGGVPLTFVPYDHSRVFNPFDKLAVYKIYQRSLADDAATAKAKIEVEKINGPVLLFSGRSDALWPSTEMGDALYERLRVNGFAHAYQHFKYADAGHTLNEHCIAGGTVEGNKRARIDTCQRMLDFLESITVASGAH